MASADSNQSKHDSVCLGRIRGTQVREELDRIKELTFFRDEVEEVLETVGARAGEGGARRQASGGMAAGRTAAPSPEQTRQRILVLRRPC